MIVCNINESAHFSMMVIFILKAQATEPGRNPLAFKLWNQNTFILYISFLGIFSKNAIISI